jgi:DNA-binding NtrC family response regulator
MAFNRFRELSQKYQDTPHTEQASQSVVLVVDDDPYIRQALQLTLSQQYQVILCASGQEAIDRVNDEVHVIVLDIKMPGKDGLHVYQDVKQRFPELPIIFHSAYQDMIEAIELRQEYQPFGYCHKSGDSDELLSKISSAIAYYERILKLQQVNLQIQKARNRFQQPTSE